ncbi:hypothetical protein EJP617_13130 [Erwinia sp. Ejp617]|nr:hypothetical protein EJP617_13130 [Erwinia sp. Ejp617]
MAVTQNYSQGRAAAILLPVAIMAVRWSNAARINQAEVAGRSSRWWLSGQGGICYGNSCPT